jgi:hypothetical protein
MKLNPPASSSDLDTARVIAQRLHERARGQEEPSVSTQAASHEPSPLGTLAPEPGAPQPQPPAPPLEPTASPAPPLAPPPPPADPYPEPDTDEPELEPATEGTGAAGLELGPDEGEVGAPESNPFQPGPFEISVPGLEEEEASVELEEETPDDAAQPEPPDAGAFEASDEPLVEAPSPFEEELEAQGQGRRPRPAPLLPPTSRRPRVGPPPRRRPRPSPRRRQRKPGSSSPTRRASTTRMP